MWSQQHATTPGAELFDQVPADTDQDSSSAVGGVQAGCQVQWSKAVFGVEGDFSTGPNANASFPNISTNPRFPGLQDGGITLSRKTDWLATLRGRVGLLVTPETLIYGTGGAAWQRSMYAGVDAFFDLPPPAGFGTGCPDDCTTTSHKTTDLGYVVGGGVEFALSSNLFLRTEYLYYRFDGVTSLGVTPPGAPVFGTGPTFKWSDLEIQTVRTGLTVKF
jgi:outer membrane immunogenic protein